MSNMIAKFGQHTLSKAEMKKVVGGTNFNCWCTGNSSGSGSFGISVNSFKQAVIMAALVSSNCGGSGTCSSVN